MSQPEHDPWSEETIYAPAEGIGGWLFLPTLNLLASPLLTGGAIAAQFMPLSRPDAMTALSGHPVFLGLTAIIVLVLAAQLLFGLLCLVQLFRKRVQLPRMMTVWYGLSIAATVISVIRFAADPGAYLQFVDPTATPGWTMGGAIFSLAVSALFIVYFDVSERVKRTFVRGDASKGIWRGLFAADPNAPKREVVAAPTDEPQGLGGWLLLPLAHLVLSPVLAVALMVMQFMRHAPRPDPHELLSHRSFLLLGMIVGLLGLGTLIYGVWCLVEFVHRSHRLPKLVKIWYALLIALGALVFLQVGTDTALFMKLAGSMAIFELSRTGVAMVLGALFLAYFIRSRRVKNTFVR